MGPDRHQLIALWADDRELATRDVDWGYIWRDELALQERFIADDFHVDTPLVGATLGLAPEGPVGFRPVQRVAE